MDVARRRLWSRRQPAPTPGREQVGGGRDHVDRAVQRRDDVPPPA